MSAPTAAPLGHVLTAMVTPFGPDRALDVKAAAKVADFLVDCGNDGIVVSGTTGESPTTTDDEKTQLLEAVLDAVGDRVRVVAGVGTNDTAHSCELARRAAAAGAHGTLVVTPYYSKPPQAGIVAHSVAVAEAGGLPVMLYDIPGRTGVKLSHETLVTLGAHELVVAVKDASGDFTAGAWVMAETDLAFYSGDDASNLSWLAHGAAGIVSVVAHVAGREYTAMIGAVERGDLVQARRINTALLPAVRAIMERTQGAITSKAALQLLGVLEHRTTRRPLVDLDEHELGPLRDDLIAAGVLSA